MEYLKNFIGPSKNQNKLPIVDKLVYQPEFTHDRDKCEQLLKNQIDKLNCKIIGTPLEIDGKRFLLIYDKQKTKFDVHDITEIDTKLLLDIGSNQMDMFSNVEKFINAAKNKFDFDVLKYQIEIVNQGEQFTTAVDYNKNAFISILALRIPTYFDLCLKYNDNIINFNVLHKTTDQFHHSGDMFGNIAGQSIQLLIHNIKQEKSYNGIITPFIAGYQNIQLVKFEQYRPIFLIWDHKNMSIKIIKIPLDKATIQNGVMCCPVVGKIINDVIHWNVLTNPAIGFESAPQFSKKTYDILNNVNNFAVEIKPQIVNQTQNVAQIIDKVGTSNSSSHIETPISNLNIERHILIIKDIEENINYIKELGIDKFKLMTFHSTFIITDENGNYDDEFHSSTKNVKYDKPNMGEIQLPCIFPNPLIGGYILALGKSIPYIKNINFDSKKKIYGNSFPIIILSENIHMTEQARDTNEFMKVNGIFIINIKQVNLNENQIKDYLMNLDINNFTSLAGPLYILMAKIKDRYFFMNGVTLNGFIDKLPKFGDDITEQMKHLSQWLENQKEFMNPLIDIRNVKIRFNGYFYKLNALLESFEKSTVDDIIENETQVTDIFTQMKRIMNDNELKQFGEKLIPILKSKICDYANNDNKDALIKDLYENVSVNKNNYIAQKKKYTEMRKKMQWLIDMTGNLVSDKKNTSFNYSIKRLEKKIKIQDNVEKSKNMTLDDLEEIFTNECSILGSLITNTNKNEIYNVLWNVANNTIKNIIPHQNLLNIDKQIMDNMTTLALLDFTQDIKDHPLACQTLSLSLPENYDNHHNSGLIFLLFDKFVEMADPSIDWVAEANKEYIAKIRILMRNTFVNANINRQSNIVINPASQDLGWLIIEITLQTLEIMASRRQSEITSEDFNDQFCQIQRGLFGFLLTTMASGMKPLTFAYKLVKKDRPEIPSTPYEWHVYNRMVKLFPFTGWNIDDLKNNVKRLLVRAIHNKISYPATEILRTEKKDSKSAEYHKEYLKQLNDKYYPAYEKLTHMVKDVIDNETETNKKLLNEIFMVFGEFNNRRVRVGSINQMKKYYNKKYPNMKHTNYINDLCAGIFSKWENENKTFKKDFSVYVLKLINNNEIPKKEEIDEFYNKFNEKSNLCDDEEIKKLFEILNNWNLENKEDTKKYINAIFKENESINWKPWKISPYPDEIIDINENKKELSTAELVISKSNTLQIILSDDNQNALNTLIQKINIPTQIFKELATFVDLGNTDDNISSQIQDMIKQLIQC